LINTNNELLKNSTQDENQEELIYINLKTVNNQIIKKIFYAHRKQIKKSVQTKNKTTYKFFLSINSTSNKKKLSRKEKMESILFTAA